MFEPVYITRDTCCMKEYAQIIPAHIGIVKLKGCVRFEPAIKNAAHFYGGFVNRNKAGATFMKLFACRRKYGSIPAKGEAWLVEEGRKYINWTQVDQDLHLLDEKGKIVKE